MADDRKALSVAYIGLLSLLLFCALLLSWETLQPPAGLAEWYLALYPVALISFLGSLLAAAVYISMGSWRREGLLWLLLQIGVEWPFALGLLCLGCYVVTLWIIKNGGLL